MKSRLITLALTAVTLLLGQQAFARQDTPVAEPAGEMLCVEVVAPAKAQLIAVGIPVEDKAALKARIKQESLDALKQAANPDLLQKHGRQAAMINGKLLQASL